MSEPTSAPAQNAPATTSAPPTTSPPATCPLTGLPAPGGRVPQRPALAVKIDNIPVARPPSGLDTADVVYEQPVEGGITRFIAIFQCRNAATILPVRSARLVDPDIVRQYGARPLFAYSGGAAHVLAKLADSPLLDIGANRAPGAYHRDSSRRAPHNLVSSTEALYAAGSEHGAANTPPPAVFHYGPLPAASERDPARTVHIPYPSSDLTWTWGAGHWSRSYATTGPATLGDGGQITTTNVIVMHVNQYTDVTGTGALQVLRNGAVVDGTWHRLRLEDLTQMVDRQGRPIDLAPGPTWVELVPPTVSVTVSP